MENEQKKELGNMIRKFRNRKLLEYNNKPWTQDDLAVAIETEKAHINRIENGKQVPTPQTLAKICDALELNWKEKRQLMAQAGHIWAEPPVMSDEAEHAINYLSPHIDNFNHPVALADKEAITWYVNDLEAFTFYGYKTKESYLADCQGLRIIELLMTPAFDNWFSRIIINFEDYLKRQVMRFMKLYYSHKHDAEYQNILTHLLQIEHMKSIWSDLQNNDENNNNIMFLNHQLLQIDHPQIGRYDIQIWHCDISFDDRLILIQHLADNINTQMLFTDLKKQFSNFQKP